MCTLSLALGCVESDVTLRPSSDSVRSDPVHAVQRPGSERPDLPDERLLAPSEERAQIRLHRLAVRVLHAHRSVRPQLAPDQRLAVGVPGEACVQRGGDRRQDVDRLGEPVIDVAACLARQLDEQRHEGDVDEVPAR